MITILVIGTAMSLPTKLNAFVWEDSSKNGQPVLKEQSAGHFSNHHRNDHY